MTAQDIRTWELSTTALLKQWKESCLNEKDRQDAILQLLSNDRSKWQEASRYIVKLCCDKTQRLAEADLGSLDTIARCAHTACMIVLHGEAAGQLADDSADAFWRHSCAVDQLLTVIVDFQDHQHGYFEHLLGSPSPSMYVQASTGSTTNGALTVTAGRRKRKAAVSIAAVNDESLYSEEGDQAKAGKARTRPPPSKRRKAQATEKRKVPIIGTWPNDIPATGDIPEKYQLQNPADMIAKDALVVVEGWYREACAHWDHTNGSLRQKNATLEADLVSSRKKMRSELNRLVDMKTAEAIARAEAAERRLVVFKTERDVEIDQVRDEKSELERQVNDLKAALASQQANAPAASILHDDAMKIDVSQGVAPNTSGVKQSGPNAPVLKTVSGGAAPTCDKATLGLDDIGEIDTVRLDPTGMTPDDAVEILRGYENFGGIASAIEREKVKLEAERDAAFGGKELWANSCSRELDWRKQSHSEYRANAQSAIGKRNAEIARLREKYGEKGPIGCRPGV